ncbi:MAG: glutathione S-transferase family protein [Bosea sp. (in: a-proteobacteria)]
MILIGQYDSPFVRRVGIALKLYGLPFTHQPWSTFGDFDKVQAHNPLVRVPTLVLDSGESLIETLAILDYLDGLMPPAQRLLPVQEPERHRAMKICALAGGIADKAVTLFYELRMHSQVSDAYVKRCSAQITAGLAELEKSFAFLAGRYWSGDKIGHADIAVAATLRFVKEAHAGRIDLSACPAVQQHAAKLEALPVFNEVAQAFIAPT